MLNIKVVLVVPPVSAYGKMGKYIKAPEPPLGLAYLASILEKNKINVEIIDAHVSNIGIEETVEKILSKKPNLIGFTTTTATFGIIIKITRLLKKRLNVPIVLGGPHVTATPIETLRKYSSVDIIIVGEGEYTLLELCQNGCTPSKGINGIVYRDNVSGKIIQTPPRQLIEDIDTIPFPSRHLLDLLSYKNPLLEIYASPETTVMTTRGCPFNCTFCASKLTFGRRVRFRSIKNVIGEIDMLIENYNIRGISFRDDTFTINAQRVEELCRELKERDLKWICNARVDTLNEKILKIMKDSGCVFVEVGVESGCQAILDDLNKGTKIEQIEKAFHMIHKVGIDSLAYMIVGSLKETRGTFYQTMKFIKKMNPTYAEFMLLTPYPGTPIYEYAKQHNLISVKDWENVGDAPQFFTPLIRHPNFSQEELKDIVRKAYKMFYFRPNYMLSQILKINSINRLKYYMRLGMAVFELVE